MSAPGFTPVQLYRSTTAAAVPTAGNLVAGELAINLTDEKLYFENASGVVKVLADSTYVGTVTSVNASGGTTGMTFSGGPITSSGTLTLSGTLAAVNGGTGQSSYVVGDILFASTTTALSKLADVATGNALISGGVGVAPLYGKIGLTTHVSGTLAVGNGGTGASTFTANGILLGNGTSAVGVTAVGTTGQVLVGNTGAAPTWTTLSGIGVTSFSAGTTGFTPSTATAGAVTLAGTLGVANGGTGVTTSTGTTSVVLSNSPVLVTPTLGAASATSIANGLGAVGTPSYTFTGDTNTGMWSPGADTLAFSEGGVEAMRIDSSGNVMVGTTSATGLFSVAGVSYGQMIATDRFGLLGNNLYYGTGNFRYIGNGHAYAWTQANTDGADYRLLYAGNNTSGGGAVATPTDRLYITSAGNVGIGTSSPATKLDVVSGAGTDNIIRSIAGNAAYMVLQGTSFFDFNAVQSYDSSSNLQWAVGGNGTANTLAFLTNGANERMRIGSDGNVGIGNTSPTVKLDVTGGIKTSRTAVTSPATSDGNIFSGTYTPTLTNSTNVDISNSTAYTCQYMRVGDVITVSGKVSIAVIGTGITRLNMTLPVASNFSADENCAGTAQVSYAGVSTNLAAQVKADITNDRAQILYFGNVTGAAQDFYFTFTYRVI